MIVIIGLTEHLLGNLSGQAGLKEGADVAVENDHRGRNRTTRNMVMPITDIQAQRTKERKGDTPLGYSRQIALKREQCGVFTPCKNCIIDTRSNVHALVGEAVFSPCRFVQNRALRCRYEVLPASPRLLPGNSCKHFVDARVGRDHMTASAVRSRVSTVPQQ
jgi:hypothetical protein